MTEDGEIPDKLLENKDVIECVRRVVESLPEEQRMCVILRYYDEMSLQEIADTLEVSLGTVKSRLSRASKKMRDEIERLEKEENKKFRCIIPFFWLRAGLEGMENETDVPKALEVKLFGKSIRRGVSVKDNYDDSVKFTAELDGKAKKSDYKAGKYTITYKAKDSSGNEVTATSKLVIKKKPEEKKKDEKVEETSDNNNGNSYNNGGDNYSNNNGGNSNNNDNWGNGGNGGSSNNNGGDSGGGNSWSWDDENGHHHGTIEGDKTPGGNDYGKGTQMWGDSFGLGYEYPYMVYPNGEITTL